MTGSQGRTPSKQKGKTYPPEILTPAEVMALIQGCSTRAPTGIRNRALLTLFYRAGLRMSEALDLQPKDIDLEAGTVTVLHGKNDHRRTVGLDSEAITMMAHWIDTRASLGINGRMNLFCTLKGARLQSAYVRALLPRLAAKAGIDKRVHAHALRHSLAYELMMEGVAVPIIQRQLGHANLATTAVYLDHIAPKDVIEAGQQRNDWWSEPT